MIDWKRWLTLAAAIVLAAATCSAQFAPDCSTPRRAAKTFIENLAVADAQPKDALRCFDWVGVAPADRLDLARQLLAVLDARGLYVAYDDLPDNTEDLAQERVELVPGRRFAAVWLERGADGWWFPAPVIDSIPRLHRETFAVDVDELLGQLPAWARGEIVAGVAWWQVLGLALALALAAGLRWVTAWLVAAQGGRMLRGRGEAADRQVLGRAARPMGSLAMAGALWYCLPLLRFGVRFNQVATVAVRVLAAAAAVMLVYRLVDVMSDVLQRRARASETRLDDQLVPLVRKALKVVVAVLGGIFVLQNLDVDVASLLAGATVGGLAFSFAAKDTVANLFGSVSIFADQPFQIGDWIAIDKYEGTVEEVGLRSTRIRTFYDSIVTIPNATVASSVVDNYGRRRRRRTSTSVALAYGTDPERVEAFCEGVRAILRANPNVDHGAYEVHLKAIGQSSLEVMLYFFLEVNTWSEELRERHHILLAILRLGHDLAVELAFPTQTVHIASVASAKDAAPPAAAPPAAG